MSFLFAVAMTIIAVAGFFACVFAAISLAHDLWTER
jgi:hypothetical protein